MRSIAKAIFKRFQIDNLVHVSVVNPKRSRDNHNATEMGTKWKDKNTEEIHVLEVQCQDQSYIIPRMDFYTFKCYFSATGTINAIYLKLRDV
jgi:hypothetical protein